NVRIVPVPPVSRNPCSRSSGVAPTPFTARIWTTEHDVVAVLIEQSPLMQGFPVASIVVTSGPSVDTTLTPANMRIASWYVPGFTRIVPPPVSLIAQIAFWILQYGSETVPDPGPGQFSAST